MLVLLLGGLSGACSGDVSIPPPTASPGAAGSPGEGAPGDAAARADAAQRALDALGTAVREGRPPSAADPFPAYLLDNATRLGLRRLDLRYLDDLSTLTPADRHRFGPDAWVAGVRVGYRLPEDRGSTRLEVAVVLVPGDDGVRVGAVGGYGGRSALWMSGPVTVRRADRLLVVAATGADRRLLGLGRTALAQVARVLPQWRGDLVIDAPASKADLDRLLAASPRTYASIAAVTTTVDGGRQPGSPVHVVLNPAVFAALRVSGAQVVLTHEATHVATDGPFAQMPTWLLEGFADYVALAHAGVPVRVAAAQVLGRVRRKGPPARLPSAADLDPTATGLGATYEEAWLACRYLAERFGEARLVAFYRAVDRGTVPRRAFASVLGVGQREFVAGWSRDLARLAG